MTDLDPFDELASAHLDGATTPEEAARIAADPALLARVEALRAVRLAVGAVPPVDHAQREVAIAAALAAYDAEGELATNPVTAAERPLTPVARRLGPSRPWRVAGVAAAVAAIVALVPLVASLSSDSSDDVASESADQEGTADRTEDAGAADTTTPGAEALGPTSTTALQRTIELGAFADDDALVAAARSTTTQSSSAFVAPTVADAGSCLDELLASLPPDAPLVLAATARLDGAPVDVVVTGDEVRIAGGDCTDVLIRPR
jgi:hypothetical protein